LIKNGPTDNFIEYPYEIYQVNDFATILKLVRKTGVFAQEFEKKPQLYFPDDFFFEALKKKAESEKNENFFLYANEQKKIYDEALEIIGSREKIEYELSGMIKNNKITLLNKIVILPSQNTNQVVASYENITNNKTALNIHSDDNLTDIYKKKLIDEINDNLRDKYNYSEISEKNFFIKNIKE
jgi:hypothetical protein